MDLLAVRPSDKNQEDNFDLVLQAWLKLCFLLIDIQQSYEARIESKYVYLLNK